jgi:hypothetical protein
MTAKDSCGKRLTRTGAISLRGRKMPEKWNIPKGAAMALSMSQDILALKFGKDANWSEMTIVSYNKGDFIGEDEKSKYCVTVSRETRRIFKFYGKVKERDGYVELFCAVHVDNINVFPCEAKLIGDGDNRYKYGLVSRGFLLCNTRFAPKDMGSCGIIEWLSEISK